MPETVSLGLPLLVAEQAQKHVTHNEALRALDAIVQLSVKDRDLASPAGSLAEGDRYIVAASPTGVWAGHAAAIAAWQDGAWEFHDARVGWRCWVDDEDVLVIFDGTTWNDIGAAISELQNLALLGIGTTADATNPFSAKLNKALWTAEYASEGGDGDLRITFNKETAADVLSLLFQTAFAGQAEFGLLGDDDLSFKIDGVEVMRLSAAGLSMFGTNPVVDLNRLHVNRTATLAGLHTGAAGKQEYATDLGGGAGLLVHDGTNWKRPGSGGYASVATDANFTLTPLADAENIRHSGTLTANRTITLSTTNAYAGARFRVTRTGTGAFTLSVGGLAFLPPNAWAEAVYDGSSWFLASCGVEYPSSRIPTGELLSKETNNEAFLRQRNAAGSAYIELLRLDAGDVTKFSGPGYYFIGTRAGAGATFPGQFAVYQVTSANSGDAILSQVGPAFTGSQYSMIANGSPTLDFIHALWNNSNNATANAKMHLRTIGAGGGDPFEVFDINGVTAFAIGLDNSDGDKFKISKAATLGTNDIVVIDPAVSMVGVGHAAPDAMLDVLGEVKERGANGQATSIKQISELLTIAAAATTDTTLDLPAGAIVLGVSVRCTVVIPTAATFTVTGATSGTTFSTAAVSTAANSTDRGTAAGAHYNAAAQKVRITPDLTPGANTGRVRVTVHYIEITPPTS